MQDFIKSLKRPGNESLIESVLKGYNVIFENEDSSLLKQLNSLKPKFAKAAQHIYDAWDATSDPDYGDWQVGFGGICHLIADKMADALSENPNMWATSNSTEYAGSPHVNIIVFNNDNTEGYIVDIDPFRYETGGGYNWKKIPDVEFDAEDVFITDIDPDDYIDENGELFESLNKIKGGKADNKIKNELIRIHANVEGDYVTLYRGGNVSIELLKNLRYGDFLSTVKTGNDAYGNEGASGYGKNVISIKLPISDIIISNGEIQYKGTSNSLHGSIKYPIKIYKAYNDYYGSNYTAKEIDKQDNVRSVASMGLSGGREEFDDLLKQHINNKTITESLNKIKGGKADKKKPSDFDPKELKMGIEIEQEHTTDKKLAEEIAMDHLTEFPNYYTELKKMEKKLESGITEAKDYDFNKLKKNKIPLTDEERKEVFKKDAVWHFGTSKDPNTGRKVEKVSAIWKAKDSNGDIVYGTNTHRAINYAKSLSSIINKYHNFIKGTA